MRTITKHYFEGYARVAQFVMGCTPVVFLLLGLLLLRDQSLTLGIVSLIVAAAFSPYLFIGLGMLRNKGMTIKLIELSNYYFGREDMARDWHVTTSELEYMDTLLTTMLTSAKPINVAAAARDLAITKDFDEREYLFLLVRANILLGGAKVLKTVKESSESKSLEEKIEELREKFKDRAKNNPSNEDDSKGKYGFL